MTGEFKRLIEANLGCDRGAGYFKIETGKKDPEADSLILANKVACYTPDTNLSDSNTICFIKIYEGQKHTANTGNDGTNDGTLGTISGYHLAVGTCATPENEAELRSRGFAPELNLDGLIK